MNQAPGTIVIRPKFFVLAFLLALFKPKGSINGAEVPLAWRQPNAFPVPPGQYQVSVWCPYLFFPRMGEATVYVDVQPGAAVEVTWDAPWVVFLPGRIQAQLIDPRMLHGGQAPMPQHQQHQHQLQQQQQPQAQAVGGGGGGWQPDPTGRHQYRWWDGTSWAAHVSDGGVTSQDPM